MKPLFAGPQDGCAVARPGAHGADGAQDIQQHDHARGRRPLQGQTATAPNGIQRPFVGPIPPDTDAIALLTAVTRGGR